MIKKTTLISLSRTFGALDSSASPYMAVQVPAGKAPVFYRSSAMHVMQSKDFNATGTRSFVSFSHFQDCLRASADNLEISVDSSGIVCIESLDGLYRNFLHVHTVREASAGIKYHDIGKPDKDILDPEAFSKLDVGSIDIAQQPSLANGILCLGTQAGLVKWRVPDSIKAVTLHPRKSFLKFICGGKAESLSISENGYWVAHKDGMVGCFSSNSMGDPLRQIFDVPGAVCTGIEGLRLVAALRSALVLCEKSDKIEMGPDRGIFCRDRYGNEATFSLGPFIPGSWAKFHITGQTADLLVAVLSQSLEKDASIQTILPKAGGPAMRIVRGPFEVDFRLVS